MNMNLIWLRTPAALIGKLSCNSLVLLSILLNRDLGSHEVEITRGAVAKQMQCSVRTVDAMLAELEQAGLILSRETTRNGLRLHLKPDILPPRKNMPYSDAKKPARTVDAAEQDAGDEMTAFGVTMREFEQVMNGSSFNGTF